MTAVLSAEAAYLPRPDEVEAWACELDAPDARIAPRFERPEPHQRLPANLKGWSAVPNARTGGN